MSYELKPKHFLLFQKLCETWQKKLGATDYLISYDFENADEDARANFINDTTGKWLHISLNMELDVKPTKNNLDIIALHEVLEGATLAKLTKMACDKYSWEEVEPEVHSIVRRVENLLFNSF